MSEPGNQHRGSNYFRSTFLIIMLYYFTIDPSVLSGEQSLRLIHQSWNGHSWNTTQDIPKTQVFKSEREEVEIGNKPWGLHKQQLRGVRRVSGSQDLLWLQLQ